MSVLVNIDVPDLRRGIDFYTRAFDLSVRRQLGAGVAELSGWPVPVFLLAKEAGTLGAGSSVRDYRRHWTPVHLDIVCTDIATALAKALDAGAKVETGIRQECWGKIATIADPFGHGLCLIEFVGRGYDEIAAPNP